MGCTEGGVRGNKVWNSSRFSSVFARLLLAKCVSSASATAGDPTEGEA